MRRMLLAVFAIAFAVSLVVPAKAQGSPPQAGADQPYTVEYYYKCQWGHQAEFLQLFLKNHYPLLRKIQSTGRVLSVKIESPAYHTSEELRWDYRVTIIYKKTQPSPPPPIPTKKPSSSSSGPIRRPTKKKSNGALRFCLAISICR